MNLPRWKHEPTAGLAASMVKLTCFGQPHLRLSFSGFSFFTFFGGVTTRELSAINSFARCSQVATSCEVRIGRPATGPRSS